MYSYFFKYSYFLKKIIWCIGLLLIVLASALDAKAQSEEELKSLLMFYKEKDLVTTSTRYPKELSRVPENMTIIKTEEIADMNAHTLKDVLNNIPGLQVDMRGGPGNISNPYIQGAESKYVLLMIDGVTLNTLSDNHPDIAVIPVQCIDHIEIIKGPASSSWGSSLGGIINIITKSPPYTGEEGGALSVSYGENETFDQRAEVFGQAKNLGYYFYFGKLDSGDFRPNTSFNGNSLYSKLRWKAGSKADFTLTLGLNYGTRGQGEFPEWDCSLKDEYNYHFSTLSLNYAINNKAEFDLSFRMSEGYSETFTNHISNGEFYPLPPDAPNPKVDEDSAYGGTAKLIFNQGINTLALGTDFDYKTLEADKVRLIDGKVSFNKYAIFANDTFNINRFFFTPGLRYDHSSINGNFWSPSFGITFKPAKKTIIKGSIAQGFNLPTIAETFGKGMFYIGNPELEVEKIRSINLGIETTEIEYLWLRLSLFKHNIWDAIDEVEYLQDPNNDTNKYTSMNKRKVVRQGLEVELKTIPIFNTSLWAGYCLIDAKDERTGKRLLDIPRYTYDIGLRYDNKNKSFKATLQGHYIWWYTQSQGQYDNFVWDLNLIKSLHTTTQIKCDVFLTVHNIFDASQYAYSYFKNTERWIEVGTRLKF